MNDCRAKHFDNYVVVMQWCVENRRVSLFYRLCSVQKWGTNWGMNDNGWVVEDMPTFPPDALFFFRAPSPWKPEHLVIMSTKFQPYYVPLLMPEPAEKPSLQWKTAWGDEKNSEEREASDEALTGCRIRHTVQTKHWQSMHEDTITCGLKELESEYWKNTPISTGHGLTLESIHFRSQTYAPFKQKQWHIAPSLQLIFLLCPFPMHSVSHHPIHLVIHCHSHLN